MRGPEDRKVLLEDVGVLVDPRSFLVEDLEREGERAEQEVSRREKERKLRVGRGEGGTLTRALVKMSCC